MPKPEPHPADSGQRLQHHNLQAIDQALALVAAHRVPGGPAFEGVVGAHLRHLIEHFDALLFPAVAGEVDYDQRPRDPALEKSATLAHTRLSAIRHHLMQAAPPAIDRPVRVHGVGGAAGELAFGVDSTWGRELAFVASHAVHHFALIQAHCRQHGIDLGADFGKAPATVAHERARAVAPGPSTKDSPCLATHPTA